MSLEDIELENVDRIERLLIEKFGKLTSQLTRSIELIRNNLKVYEFDEPLLNRINDVMYKASLSENIKTVEVDIKHLADTLWDQEGMA